MVRSDINLKFQFDNAPYRTLLLRRLRLALGLAPAHCRCGRAMDAYGDHRAACATSGALRARAVPIERALARIFREAGARVHMHVPLANMNFDPPPADARAIEILAQGLPLYQGAQLAVDATLIVSLVGRDGTAHPHTTTTPGAAIAQATRRKRVSVYPEFEQQRRCRLIVVGLEVGGRWGQEAHTLLHRLAVAKARSVQQPLRAAAVGAHTRRWAALLSCAASHAFAASLLELPLGAADHTDGDPPPLPDLLAEARDDTPPLPSRLPRTQGA